MNGKLLLGKLPATRPYGLSDLSEYVEGKLPAPPTTCEYFEGLSLPLDGNGQYGDCVMAGVAHLDEAFDAEVPVDDSVPTEQQVVAEYLKLSPNDSGLNEADVLKLWHTTGLFGTKIAGYAPVPINNILAIHQAIAFYGGSMFGIQCPASAQRQFQDNKPWTYAPGSPILGGHCIVALGYSPSGVYCATWGGVALVTYPFLAAYLDEAWAIIAQQFVQIGKGPNLSLSVLQKDLASV